MKVFVSSVISGFEAYRSAAVEAIESLGHEAIRAEDFAATSKSPRIACLDGVRRADLVVILLGARYGEIQESGLSATHEEFEEAKRTKEILAFVEKGTDAEPAQVAFRAAVRDWGNGVFSGSFQDSDSLRSQVVKSIHRHEVERLAGAPNPTTILERGRALFPVGRGRSSSSTSLALVIVSAPTQAIVRPTRMEEEAFGDELVQIALHGRHKLLTLREGTESDVVNGALTFTQKSRLVSIHGDGSLVVSTPVETQDHMAIVEEGIRECLLRGLGFFAEVLEKIDAVGRITHVCPMADILGAGHMGWTTRSRGRTGGINLRPSFGADDTSPVCLDPPVRARASVRTQANEIADDLVVLLRRRFS